MARFIVKGQKITADKAVLAKHLRQRMTPAERLLWERLRAKQLFGFHFRRQQIIQGYIVDFYCHSTGVVVEVDGGIHQEQRDADNFREQVIQALGLRILRVTNSEVIENLDDVLRQIEVICTNR